MKHIVFAFCLLVTCSSCWNKTEDEYNDVNIRLENLTGEDLTGVTLGQRIYKPGGLNFVEYQISIDVLKANVITEYNDTQGQFMGYRSFRGHIDNDPITWSDENKDNLFLEAGAYQDEWQNPFTDSIWEGLSLEKGNYTYSITRAEDNRFFRIEIIPE